MAGCSRYAMYGGWMPIDICRLPALPLPAAGCPVSAMDPLLHYPVAVAPAYAVVAPSLLVVIALLLPCPAVALSPVVLHALPRHGGCLASPAVVVLCPPVCRVAMLSPLCCRLVFACLLLSVCCYAVASCCSGGGSSPCVLLLSPWRRPCPLRCRPSSVSPSCGNPWTTPPRASGTCTG